MAFISVFVERDHRCQRQGRAFKTDDENKEMTARHHEIHSEECYEEKLIKLAATNHLVFARSPFQRLDQNDQDTDIQYVFYRYYGRRSLIHAREAVNHSVTDH